MIISNKKPKGRFFIVGKQGGQPVAEWTVTVTAGANGSVSVDDTPGDFAEMVVDGTVLVLEATASEHYAFTQWSDGNTDNPRTITVTSDIALSSENDPLSYSVRVFSNGNGDVSVDGTVGDYDDYCSFDTSLALEALPATDYSFDSWSDGNTSATRTVTVTDDIVLSASFQEEAPTMYHVNIYSNGDGDVEVDNMLGDFDDYVAENTQLVIDAIPAQNYEFVQWSDGDSTSYRTLTITSDITLSASFQEVVPPVVEWNVSVYSNGNGSVSVDGTPGDFAEMVVDGTVLVLEATPADQSYEFDSWSDGDTSNPRTLTVDNDISLGASFKEAQPQPDYFYVEDISGSNNTLSIKKSNTSAPTIEVFKSEDGQNWSSMGSTSTTPITVTIPSNGKVYLKCTTNSWTANRFNTSNVITASGSHRIGGKIMSLLKGDNYEGATFDSSNAYAFCRSFSDDTYLTDASNLILPTNVADYCYAYMFLNCTSLVTGPVLPATTLSQWCYCYMFNTCSSLTSVTTYAQDISATNCVGTWLGNVAATGTFHNLGTATYPSGASGVPSGWTEVHS